MSVSVLEDFVLALNKGWAPIGTCTVRMAFTHLCAGTAKFLNTDDYQAHDYATWVDVPLRPGDAIVRTAHNELRAPDVIILRYNKMPTKSVMAYSRKNLLKRDKMMCQYCGSKPNPRDLTVDHVFPRAKGGITHWTNCVMCCQDCNNKKADKTLDESEMRLIDRPEMKLIHPHDKKKWNEPYVPAWSPIFNVGPNRFKDSWAGFVGKKHTELALL
jgi:5-methylcytosine-specific restriction endonuclease McrA